MRSRGCEAGLFQLACPLRPGDVWRQRDGDSEGVLPTRNSTLFLPLLLCSLPLHMSSNDASKQDGGYCMPVDGRLTGLDNLYAIERRKAMRDSASMTVSIVSPPSHWQDRWLSLSLSPLLSPPERDWLPGARPAGLLILARHSAEHSKASLSR